MKAVAPGALRAQCVLRSRSFALHIAALAVTDTLEILYFRDTHMAHHPQPEVGVGRMPSRTNCFWRHALW